MKSISVKIISLLLMAAVLLGVTSCSLTGKDDEETTETTIASASAVPMDEAAIINYFNSLMQKINSGKAALKYSSDYNARGFECDNAALKAALPTIVKLMRNSKDSALKSGAEIAYGESLADILPIKGTANALVLTADDIVEIAVNADEFNRLAEEESKMAADKDYSTTAIINTDPDVRRVTITLRDETDPKSGEGLFGGIFDLPDRNAIKANFDSAKDYITYDGTYTAKYTGCTVYMEIDRLTDNVIKLEFNRNIEISATVTGVGTLASVGTVPLSFTVTGQDKYEFDWTNPDENI